MGDKGVRTPLKNHKIVGLLSNSGPGPLKTKPAFNVGPSSARQRNAIEMPAFSGIMITSPLINYIEKKPTFLLSGSPHVQLYFLDPHMFNCTLIAACALIRLIPVMISYEVFADCLNTLGWKNL